MVVRSWSSMSSSSSPQALLTQAAASVYRHLPLAVVFQGLFQGAWSYKAGMVGTADLT